MKNNTYLLERIIVKLGAIERGGERRIEGGHIGEREFDVSYYEISSHPMNAVLYTDPYKAHEAGQKKHDEEYEKVIAGRKM